MLDDTPAGDDRPVWHFTPPVGWMNDPNGLILRDGRYHLFYQHNPDAPVWGNLHWGHATSADLVTWEHQPIALRPDANGQMYSGCVVDDAAGSADFGAGALVAVFTQDLDGEQYQSLAWSLDDGFTWTPYEHNPVLRAPHGHRDFRDPKVIAHRGGWVMVLAVGSEIWVYRSPDLRTWDRIGTLRPPLPAPGSIVEVPDLVEVAVHDSGESVWLLVFSAEPPRGTAQHDRQVHWIPVDFDGDAPVIEPNETARLLDAGRTFYAALTWAAFGERPPAVMGWMDERTAPFGQARSWCGRQSVARNLVLSRRHDRLVLHQQPVLPVDEVARIDVRAGAVDTAAIGSGAVAIKVRPCAGQPRIETVVVELRSTGPAAGVPVRVSLESDGLRLSGLAGGDVSMGRCQRDDGGLTVVYDEGSIEVFADDGVNVASGFVPMLAGPWTVSIDGDGADLGIEVLHSRSVPTDGLAAG